MFNFEEKLKALESTKKAEEIESIVSEISKQFKEMYSEEISNKDVIKLMYYANAYHKSTKYTGGISIPVLGLTRSGKSTLINSALGCNIRPSELDKNNIRFENPIATVGDTLLSSTIYAECHSAPQQSDYCYIDTAGFLDTCNVVSTGIADYLEDKEFITNLSTLSLEICIKNVMRHNPENGMPALIVVVNYKGLTGGGAGDSLKFVKILHSLLGSNEALSNRLIFVVTHADDRRDALKSRYKKLVKTGNTEIKKQSKDVWVRASIIAKIKENYEATLKKMEEQHGLRGTVKTTLTNTIDGAISAVTGIEARSSDSLQQNGLTLEEIAWFISLLDKTSNSQQIVIADFEKGKKTKEALETIIDRISAQYGSSIGLDCFNFKSIYGQKEHVRYFSELSGTIIQRSLKFFDDFKKIDSEHNNYAALLDNLENQVVGSQEYLSSISKANLNKITARTAVLQNEKRYLETLITEQDTEEPFEEHVFRELTHYIVLEDMHLNDIKRSCSVPGCFLYRDETNKEMLALINKQREVVAQVEVWRLGDKLKSLYWPSLDEYVEVTDDHNRLPQEIRDEIIEEYKRRLLQANGAQKLLQKSFREPEKNDSQELLQKPFREGESVRFYIVYGIHPSDFGQSSIHYSDPGFYIYHTKDGKINVHVLHISLPHGISSVFELSSVNHQAGNDKSRFSEGGPYQKKSSVQPYFGYPYSGPRWPQPSSVNHENGNNKISLLRLKRPHNKIVLEQPLPEFVMDYAVNHLDKEEHDRIYKDLLGQDMPPLKEISGKRKHYLPCLIETFKEKRSQFINIRSFSYSKYRFDIKTNYRTVDDEYTKLHKSDTYIPSSHIKSGVTFHLLHRNNESFLDPDNLYLIKDVSGKNIIYYLGFTCELGTQCKYSSLMLKPFINESTLDILNGISEFNKLGGMDMPKIILDESILEEFTRKDPNILVDRIKTLIHRNRGSRYVALYETKLRKDGLAEVYLYAKRNELPHIIQEIEAKKTRIDSINSEITALEKQIALRKNIDANFVNEKDLLKRLEEAKKQISKELLHVKEQRRLQLQKLSEFDYILKPFAEIYGLLGISPNDNSRINKFILTLKELRKNFSWYDDTKLLNLINAAVGKENPAIHVFPATPSDPDFSHLKEIVNGYLQGENRNLVKNKLFIPINLNDNHWVLITVTHDAQTIIYFDPLGNPFPKQLNTALKSNDCFPGFALIDMRLELQEDGCNCGPWVVEFAKKVIAGANINEKGQFDRIDIIAARKQHNETLSRLPYQDSAIISPRIDSSKTNSHKASRLPSTAGTNASNNSHTHAATAGFFSPRRQEGNHSSSTSSNGDRKDVSLVKK